MVKFNRSFIRWRKDTHLFNLCALTLNMRIPIEVSNDQPREYDACNPIRGHKGEVNPAEIARLYNGVLVNQHADKDRNASPIPAAKTTINTGRYHARCTQQMENFGDAKCFRLSQPGRH